MLITKRKKSLLVLTLALALFLSSCNPSVPTIVPKEDPIVIEGDYSWVIEPKYNDAKMNSENGLFAVSSAEEGGLWGYIDVNGKTVLPFVYEKALPFVGNFGAVMENGNWGIVDVEGNYLSQPFGVTPFESGEGLTAYCEDGAWGYLSNDGNMVIPPEYDAAAPFCYGAATVKKNGLEGTIDTDGNYIIEPNWYMAQKINERFFIIGENTADGVLYGIADEKGNVRFAPRYTEISRAGRSYFTYVTVAEKKAADAAGRPPKKGLVTASGVTLEKCEYENFIAFENGHCAFQKEDKYGIFNNFGEMIYKAEYEGVYLCTDYEGNIFLRLTMDTHPQNDIYLDNMGKERVGLTTISGVTEPSVVGNFQNGYALFTDVSKKYGVVGMDGTVLYPALYDSVTLLQGGHYFQLEKAGKVGLGDKTGHILLAPSQGYDGLFSVSAEAELAYFGVLTHVEKNGTLEDAYGYIRKNGTNVSLAIPPRFETLGAVYCTEDGKYYAMAKENGLYGIIELIMRN